MEKIIVYTMSYEKAKELGLVGDLELKLKCVIGKDFNSATQAYNNMKLKAHNLGATHIFKKEQGTSGKEYSPNFNFIVYGDAYGPKK